MTGGTARRAGLAGRLLAGLLILAFFAAVGASALVLPSLGAGGNLVDFDAFYLVGRLVAEGRAAAAYDPAVMAGLQQALVGHAGFMPWSYPPMFDLLVAPLPALPRGLSYALFTGLTLAAYLAVLARLAGRSLPLVLLALAPPIYVCATIGQNGFLTGALMGGFALLSLAGRPAAGWPLGLLVIKPHLGLGLAVQALAAGRWPVLARAALLGLGLAALATLLLGPSIWPAFRAGLAASGEALATGFYPLFRMTSVYALLHTLGAPPGLALAVQGGTGLLACGLVARAVRAGLAPRQTLAMACFAAALVSPYLYDYDLVAAGVGLALIAPDLQARSTLPERLVLLALAWVAGGWGLIHALATAGLAWEDRAAAMRETPSYGAVACLLALALIARLLRRPGPPA